MNLSLWNLFAFTGALLALATKTKGRARIPAMAAAVAFAYPVAWALTGIMGALAYTTGLLLWITVWRNLRPGSLKLTPGLHPISAALLLVISLTLYAAALGPIKADLYFAPGLEHPAVVAGLMWITTLPSVRPLGDYALVFPIATLLALSGAHDSRNAWDFYLDPALAIFTAISLTRWFRRKKAAEKATVPAGSVA